MPLTTYEIPIHFIRTTDSAETQRIEDGTLFFHPRTLREILLKDTRISQIEIETAHPGDSIRILPVKDVIAPRAKRDGSIFPGTVNPITPVGRGETVSLEGCAIVTTGPIVGFQEGIIDMQGPLTEYSPFGSLQLIVLDITPAVGITPHEHEEAVRLAGLKAACEIGRIGLDAMQKPTRQIDFKAKDDSLPAIVYIDLCMAQGLLHDTYYYGGKLADMTPIPIHPASLYDGALVSGNCVSPGSKTTTYHHQNNAILKELARESESRFQLAGMILSPLKTRLADKRRNAMLVSEIAVSFGAQGAVISQEGFGNPTTDLMMICENLEKAGIKTVLISNEDAGTDGFSESLPDSTPYADAIISTGNSNQRIILPPMERIIGNLSSIESITGGFHGSILPDGSLEIEIHGIMGSHNLQGMTKLGARTV